MLPDVLNLEQHSRIGACASQVVMGRILLRCDATQAGAADGADW